MATLPNAPRTAARRCSTADDLVSNLHGKVGKTAMTKVLANLVAANVITQKVYGKQVVFVVRQVRVFLPLQAPTRMQRADEGEEVKPVSGMCARPQDNLEAPSQAELDSMDSELAALKQELAALKAESKELGGGASAKREKAHVARDVEAPTTRLRGARAEVAYRGVEADELHDGRANGPASGPSDGRGAGTATARVQADRMASR